MGDLSGKYKVFLGNRSRGLRYTYKDRVQLEDMFPRPDGTPGNLTSLIEVHLVNPGGGAFRVQSTLLWKGLHCVNSKISLLKVQEWLEKHVADNGDLAAIYRPTINAFFASGVLGKIIDDAFPDVDVDADEDADEDTPESPKVTKGATPKS